MFIDFLLLMLLNMTGALLTIAAFLVCGMKEEKPSRWAAPFIITGVIALCCGLRMVWTWPLPGPYNSVFGEMTVLLGGLMLGAGISLAAGWSLLPMAGLAFVAGAAAVATGGWIISLGLTAKPVLSGIAFIITGLGGVFAVLPLAFPRNWVLRYAGAALMVMAAIMWATTSYLTIPAHIENSKHYTPPGMTVKK
jgi:putative membrane protein